ncbi:protein kinase [Candidatus Uabimicrobium sp. HlEnr_7]|uniref:protein kinase domain-containing protein n=1 Tax=Candidatus Uabimicrobium helgolandensis TaxID=3095367 RepID=UPI0035575645
MEMIQKIDNYQILEQLGFEEETTIFKAQKANEIFTIYISPYRGENRYAAFEENAKKIIKINHCNIRKIFKVGKEKNYFYYVKNYLKEYNTLLDMIYNETRKFEQFEVINIICQVALALEYAAQFGIVHGLLHPYKVEFSNEKPFICFANSYEFPFKVVGRPVFASPECVIGKSKEVTSDIFSLGSIAYFMTTGVFPFEEKTSVLLIQAILKKKPLPIAKYNTKISVKMCKIIKKMMAKKVKKRYQHYSQIVQDLQSI